MPLYEYRCHKCGKVFEIIQKFSDAPLETHQDCGGAVERLLSTPALQFKGSGWYITDYAKNSSGSGAKKPDESKPPTTETKTETKTESKPAAPAASSEK
jgi:putative FmdB family regulatory protein